MTKSRLGHFKIHPSRLIIEDGKGWLYDQYNNALFSLVISDQLIISPIFKIDISEDNNRSRIAYSGIIKCDNKIVFIPSFKLPFIIFDVETGEVTYIEYNYNLRCLDGHLFGGAYFHDENVFFIPYAYQGVVSLNIKTKELNEYKLHKSDNEWIYNAWSNYWLEDNKIVFISLEKATLFYFNLESKDITKEKLYLDDKWLLGASICRDEKIIVPANTSYGIRITNNTKSEVNVDYPDGFISGQLNFSEIVDLDDKALLTPRDANMCLLFDKTCCHFRCINHFEAINDDFFEKYYKYVYLAKYDNKYMFWDERLSEVVIYNYEFNEVERKRTVCDIKEFASYFWKMPVHENIENDLCTFLQVI